MASPIASDYQHPHPHLIVILSKPSHLFLDFISLIKIYTKLYALMMVGLSKSVPKMYTAGRERGYNYVPDGSAGCD